MQSRVVESYAAVQKFSVLLGENTFADALLECIESGINGLVLFGGEDAGFGHITAQVSCKLFGVLT